MREAMSAILNSRSSVSRLQESMEGKLFHLAIVQGTPTWAHDVRCAR